MDIKILSPEDAAAIAVGLDLRPVELSPEEKIALADKLDVVWAVYCQRDPALSGVLVFDFDGLDAFIVETNDGLHYLAISSIVTTISKVMVSVIAADTFATEDIVMAGDELQQIDDDMPLEEILRRAVIAAQHATQSARFAEYAVRKAMFARSHNVKSE